MDGSYGNIKKEIELDRILSEEHPDDCVYVYFVQDGRKITPAIIKNYGAHSDFLNDLRNTFGAHEYLVMIRRKRTMICTCRVSFCAPIGFIPKKDVVAEIERLRRKEHKKKS